MKNALKLFLLSCFHVFSMTLFAQQAPMYTHYMYNTLSINPAYAGSRDALTLTALHRSQWVRFKGAPTTQTLTMHSPIAGKNIGLGLSLSNDRIGIVNNTSAFLSFAYKMQLTPKSKLSLGVSGGVNLLQANLSSLALNEQNDPTFQSNIKNKSLGNFGFGMYYSRERFYAGISVPNLAQNNYDGNLISNGTATTGIERRHYFFVAGALMNLGNTVDFKPTTLVKVTEAAPVQLDVTASFIFNHLFTLGGMYRTGDAVGLLLGMNVSPQFYLGYSYDWSFGNRTFTYNSGSHEVVLRYDFIQASKRQIHSPRYF
jgi:type IX secretion system PorP/SprF family membrane protein